MKSTTQSYQPARTGHLETNVLSSTLKHLRLACLSLCLATSGGAVFAQQPASQEVNLYTTREPKLIQPLIEAFTSQTGIKVHTAFIKDGMVEKLKSEQNHSPADVLMVVDIGQVVDLEQASAFQATDSSALNTAIAAHLRSDQGTWYAFSLRDRVLYADPRLNLKAFTYEQLASPEWKGKVCIRSGQHPYNIGLIAAMLAHNGPEKTEQWLREVKLNLARPAVGGDRDVARDILGGICELGIANAYYAGQMKTAKAGTDARKWGDAIQVIRPTFSQSGGTFVNISAAGVAQHAPNKQNAVKFLEFLASETGQSLYARADFEYPVRSGVALDPIVESFGPLHPDTLPIKEIASLRKQASALVDKVKFDY